ncbi:arsenite methyltransferase [Anaeramoeba flamelloides]|uniref:Arsenite methyltransferase n=1 Tax=Anaeramoeba flamelloides TaxID=1746091 RepID=A0ABQ8X9D2_9EUKA|nr:arsenite methyltransferase [Anaeramoeba flamelloides]
MTEEKQKQEKQVKEVKEYYSSLATEIEKPNEEKRKEIAKHFYGEKDSELLEEESNLCVSCGNPTADIYWREGITILDLGCGSGIDLFLSAKKIGKTGTVIGLDMSEEMLNRTRKIMEKKGITNIKLLHGRIEKIPLEDNVCDYVTSNCVLNLVPDKAQAFSEIFRVLKPGGILTASDIVLKKTLPQEIKEDSIKYVGCIGGAIMPEQYQENLENAGFTSIVIEDMKKDLNMHKWVMNSSCCGKKKETEKSCCSKQEVTETKKSCCSNEQETVKSCCSNKKVIETKCCSNENQELTQEETEKRKKLLEYDLNDYAGSSKILAKKPRK